jgi:hypothetical protein
VHGWSPVRSEAPRRRSLHLRHPRRSTRTGTRQPTISATSTTTHPRSQRLAADRPWGCVDIYSWLGGAPAWWCCGRRRDGNVGFEDSNTSRLSTRLIRNSDRNDCRSSTRVRSRCNTCSPRPLARPSGFPLHTMLPEKVPRGSDSTGEPHRYLP